MVHTKYIYTLDIDTIYPFNIPVRVPLYPYHISFTFPLHCQLYSQFCWLCFPTYLFFWGAGPGFAIFQRRTPCQLPCRCIFWKPRSVVPWATLSGDGTWDFFGQNPAVWQLFLWCFPLLLWFLDVFGGSSPRKKGYIAEIPGSLEFRGNTCWNHPEIWM